MKKSKVPSREEVSENNRTNFDNLVNAIGFLPNLYATIAYSETGLEKYLAYQQAKTSLSGKEKEAVNLVVSEVNGCRYCLSAHTVLGKVNGFSEEEILDLRSGTSQDAKLYALVKLARNIAEKWGYISHQHLDDFYAVGYNDGNLVDLVLQISDSTAMNLLYNLLKVPIDFPLAASLETTSIHPC